jgi:hypothetical protein
VIAQGAAELLATGRLDVATLLHAYRGLSPVGHPGAGADAPDCDFLAAAWSLGGVGLLGGHQVRVCGAPPRALPTAEPLEGGAGVRLSLARGQDAAGDALALALGVAMESAKLQPLLDDVPPASATLDEIASRLALSRDALAAAFGSADDAVQALLSAAAAGPDRELVLDDGAPPVQPDALDDVIFDVAVDGDGPVFVLAGATERLHDMLSPYVRRLAAPLGRLAGAATDDARYDALRLLVTAEPDSHAERVAAETRDGISHCGSALVVRFEALDPSAVDERARNTVRQLKSRRALGVVTGRSPAALGDALDRCGARARVVVLLAEAFAGEEARAWPDVILDAASGHPFDVDNALCDANAEEPITAHISAPSLGLTPAPLVRERWAVDALLAPLLAETGAARARGALGRGARVALGSFAPGDGAHASSVALRVLERMAAGVAPAPKRRGR